MLEHNCAAASTEIQAANSLLESGPRRGAGQRHLLTPEKMVSFVGMVMGRRISSGCNPHQTVMLLGKLSCLGRWHQGGEKVNLGLLGKAFYTGKGEALSLHIKAMNGHGITWLQRPNGSHPRLAQFTDQNKAFQVAQPAPKNQPATSSPPASSLIPHRGTLEHNWHGKQSRHTARCFALISAVPRWQPQKFVPVSLLHWRKWKKITGDRGCDGVRAVLQTASACWRSPPCFSPKSFNSAHITFRQPNSSEVQHTHLPQA